ncbi:hypothetical protein LOK49_LG14G00575 [Camellia lanceoleosa]|uniref:Uncharacterized protein n=1 Tax=Camellia lanceoleosa TaxID=1840588 RepID=A0ACC0FDI3_9ERIC|nr:hypothetical protein LOK49_LG14G00575 [Camellia lanceoleosa]
MCLSWYTKKRTDCLHPISIYVEFTSSNFESNGCDNYGSALRSFEVYHDFNSEIYRRASKSFETNDCFSSKLFTKIAEDPNVLKAVF